MQLLAIAICVMINMMNGFDVLVTSFTAPALAKDWGLSMQTLGVLFSAGLVGMTAGSLFIAPLADKIGRKKIILLALIIISLGMGLSGISQSVVELVIWRIVTGLGVGASLASLNTIVSEYSSPEKKNIAISFLMSGYPVGGLLGGLVAAALIADYGWRFLFLFGGAISALMPPLVLWKLPESHVHSNTSSGVRQIFSWQTLSLWTSYFMLMFSFYFVISWTPKILVDSGLSVQSGISGSVLMNLSGVIGGLSLGWFSSKGNLSKVIGRYMCLSAVFIAFFGWIIGMGAYPLLGVAFATGFFIFGSMIGLYALAPDVYPAEIRGTGMGFAIGIGRLGAIAGPWTAGILLEKGVNMPTCFYLFALPLGVAWLAVLSIARGRPIRKWEEKQQKASL